MGATSNLYLLDYDVLADCVAPAVLRLVETGRPGLWLQWFWDENMAGRRLSDGWREPFFAMPVADAASSIVYLDADLSEMPGAVPGDGYPSWPRDKMGAGDLMTFVERLVASYCFRDYWHFGNAVSIFMKWDWYSDFVPHNHPQTNRLDVLIGLLDRRGRHWCHGSGGFAEGIHGWLRPDETAELAHLMESLPLPACEPTWSALKEWDRLNGYGPEMQLYEGAYYAKFVLFLRIAAASAARSRLGLLYGNDIVPDGRGYQIKRRTDPDWLRWRNDLLPRAARSIRESRAFADLPILGDMLEEASCEEADMIVHCREELPHKKTCWVLNMLADGAPNCRDMFGLVDGPID